MVSFCFLEVPGTVEIIKPESRMVVARGDRKEVGGGFVSWVQSLFFFQRRSVLEVGGSMVTQKSQCT